MGRAGIRTPTQYHLEGIPWWRRNSAMHYFDAGGRRGCGSVMHCRAADCITPHQAYMHVQTTENYQCFMTMKFIPAAHSCLKIVRLLRTNQQSPTVCGAQFALGTVANSQSSPIFLWTAVTIPWIDIIPQSWGWRSSGRDSTGFILPTGHFSTNMQRVATSLWNFCQSRQRYIITDNTCNCCLIIQPQI